MKMRHPPPIHSPKPTNATQQKTPAVSDRGFEFRCAKDLSDLHRVSLETFLALHDGEGDLLAFLQGLEAAALDGTEVDEEVLTAFRGNEAEALGVVEPLDGAALTI